jgi:hypothetical protein
MISPFTDFETQRLARCRLLEEVLRRRLPGGGGWSHRGTQCATEPTALALVALHSGGIVTKDRIRPLMATQGADGLWCAVGGGATGSFWATALAVNTLLILNANTTSYTHSLEALVRGCPLEASWLVRLRSGFRIDTFSSTPKNTAGRGCPIP